MKRIIGIILSALIAAAILTACGPNQAEIDESIALESAQARLAAAEAESQSIEESRAAEKDKAPFYEPTDEEKELICGDWYRSKKDGGGDTDLYWLSMKEDGTCTFAHETLKSKDYIDKLDGTWFVDEHDFVNIDLGKYAGKFRFIKNAYGSTNIICNGGDDFVESGDEGAYAAFVPVKWYKGNLRFVENKKAAETETQTTTATASQGSTHEMITVEMQGEGDSWYRLAGVEGMCKVDVDTREGENPCWLALNQNDHLVVRIQQIR